MLNFFRISTSFLILIGLHNIPKIWREMLGFIKFCFIALVLIFSSLCYSFPASSLVQEVIKYATSIASCRGVYLHVISYNQPAINFYKKMLFRLVRRLSHFYYIRGCHYDSYLFVYYVNGGRSPCSPL